MECDALKDWKLNIFKIIDRHISFYSQNTNILPRKPKTTSYRYLKLGCCCLTVTAHNTLKQELSGTKAHEQTSVEEKSVINHHIFMPRHKKSGGVLCYTLRTFECLSVRPSVRPSAAHNSCPLHNFDTVRDNFTKLDRNIKHDQSTCRD